MASIAGPGPAGSAPSAADNQLEFARIGREPYYGSNGLTYGGYADVGSGPPEAPTARSSYGQSPYSQAGYGYSPYSQAAYGYSPYATMSYGMQPQQQGGSSSPYDFLAPYLQGMNGVLGGVTDTMGLMRSALNSGTIGTPYNFPWMSPYNGFMGNNQSIGGINPGPSRNQSSYAYPVTRNPFIYRAGGNQYAG